MFHILLTSTWVVKQSNKKTNSIVFLFFFLKGPMFTFETFSGGAELSWSSCCESVCHLSGILHLDDFRPQSFTPVDLLHNLHWLYFPEFPWMHPDWSLISATTSAALLCLSTRGRLWTAFVYTQLMNLFEPREVLLTLSATNNLVITSEHW